jgi:hypothetical protein
MTKTTGLKSREAAFLLGFLRVGPGRPPVFFPAFSLLLLFVPCYELAPSRKKAHGIKVLHACGNQKREIFPVNFPVHGNLQHIFFPVSRQLAKRCSS